MRVRIIRTGDAGACDQPSHDRFLFRGLRQSRGQSSGAAGSLARLRAWHRDRAIRTPMSNSLCHVVDTQGCCKHLECAEDRGLSLRDVRRPSWVLPSVAHLKQGDWVYPVMISAGSLFVITAACASPPSFPTRTTPGIAGRSA